MGALHPGPNQAMIVHPCDLSVKPLLSKGTKGNGEGGSNRDGGVQSEWGASAGHTGTVGTGKHFFQALIAKFSVVDQFMRPSSNVTAIQALSSISSSP